MEKIEKNNQEKDTLSKKEEEELIELERLAKEERENNIKKIIKKIKEKEKRFEEFQRIKKKEKEAFIIKKIIKLKKVKGDNNYIFGKKIDREIPGPGQYSMNKRIEKSSPCYTFGYGRDRFYSPGLSFLGPGTYNI